MDSLILALRILAISFNFLLKQNMITLDSIGVWIKILFSLFFLMHLLNGLLLLALSIKFFS